MRKIISVIFILFAVAVASAIGQNKIDSLQNCLTNTHNEERRVELLHQLTQEYTNIDPDVAINYGQEALDISEDLEYPKNIALSLQYLGVAALGQGKYKKALRYLNKALKVFEENMLRDGTVSCLNSIATVYLAQSDHDTALEYYEKVSDFQKKYKTHKLSCGKAYNNTAVIYLEKGEYEKSLEFSKHALRLFTELKDQSRMAMCYNNMGLVYRRQGVLQKSLENHSLALDIWQKEGNQKRSSEALTNMGKTYLKEGNKEKAMECHQKALQIRQGLNLKNGLLHSLHNIGLVYFVQGEYDKALECYQKTLPLTEEVGSPADLSELLNDMGKAFFKKGMHRQAIAHCERSLELAEKLDIYEHIVTACRLLDKAYTAINDSKNAIKYRRKAQKAEEGYKAMVTFLHNKELSAKVFKSLKEKIHLIIGLAVVALALTVFFLLRYRKKGMGKLRDEHEETIDLEVDMMVYGRLEAERKKQKRKEQLNAQLFLSNLFNPPKS